ncbi:DUF4476 domain-containing protein [Phaeocystidibacter luteus]|uniref:DUF4476 domain-containing protein n=1 Tax=Phaeocystidibacter luteus TaxID=911197 RepID=A0A6N6RK65_9FLAO|nr:DUF4476 domain-containing protein [Phaeocystidibacter luteus]KAB2814228.1 DUF4476 domain-containing protein [Phaeocystidibacter luteus]
MLVSVRIVTFLILLSTWTVSAQVIQVDLPQSADLILDSVKIGENLTSAAFETDTNPHILYVIRDSTLVTSKTIKLGISEKRKYILEDDGLGSERLFYRSGPVTTEITSISGNSTFDVASVSTAFISIEDSIRMDSALTDLPEPDVIAIADPDSLEIEVETFDQALDRISEIDLEFDRSQAMIAWAGKNDMTVAQIRKFGELSAFDPSRFMLLQRLYPFCTDAENFGSLRDLFDFNQYKNQFSEWLAKQSEVE